MRPSERLSNRTDGYGSLGASSYRWLQRIQYGSASNSASNHGRNPSEPMFLLLLGAGSRSYLIMEDAHEALVLLGFVVVIMAMTVLQERRTECAESTT